VGASDQDLDRGAEHVAERQHRRDVAHPRPQERERHQVAGHHREHAHVDLEQAQRALHEERRRADGDEDREREEPGAGEGDRQEGEVDGVGGEHRARAGEQEITVIGSATRARSGHGREVAAGVGDNGWIGRKSRIDSVPCRISSLICQVTQEPVTLRTISAAR